MLHAKFFEISPPVPEKKILKAFTICRHGLFMYTLVLPSYRCFISNLALIGHAVSEKKIFENYGDIHVYCPGIKGRPAPLSNFFRIINLQSIYPFPFFISKIFSSNDILTILPFQMHGPPM